MALVSKSLLIKATLTISICSFAACSLPSNSERVDSRTNASANASAPKAGSEDSEKDVGEFAFLLPALDLPNPISDETITILVDGIDNQKTNAEKTVPYVAGAEVKFPGLRAGKYSVKVKVVSRGETILEGASDVTVVALKKSGVSIVLEHSVGNSGDLIVKILPPRKDQTACRFLQSPVPLACAVEITRCSYTSKWPSRIFEAKAQCGEVFSRRELFNQLCNANIPFPDTELAAVRCETLVDPKPTPIPPNDNQVDICAISELVPDCSDSDDKTMEECSVELSLPANTNTDKDVNILMASELVTARGTRHCGAARYALYEALCRKSKMILKSTFNNIKCDEFVIEVLVEPEPPTMIE